MYLQLMNITKTESNNYQDNYEVGEHGNETVTTIEIQGRESDEGYMGQWELEHRV